METFRLEFNPKIKAKILELLSSFSADELKIIREDEFLDEHFEENKSKLEVFLSKIKNGTAKLYTIEEVSTYLDKTISEYDN